MEETLFDIKGNPVAYIAYDNEPVIYMWKGKPVAYLYGDCIFGFNGKHLGWFEKGIVWNMDGLINGFNKNSADVYLSFEPFKGFKEFLPIKSFKEFAHMKPLYKMTKSSCPLSKLLMSGAD